MLQYIIPDPNAMYYDTALLDYAAFSAPLIFPINAMPGQQECFNIQPFIVDDFFVEYPESFRIMLSSPDPSARFRNGTDCATINIADNDRRFLVKFNYNYKQYTHNNEDVPDNFMIHHCKINITIKLSKI